jgi:hypothetical protein
MQSPSLWHHRDAISVALGAVSIKTGTCALRRSGANTDV